MLVNSHVQVRWLMKLADPIDALSVSSDNS